MTCSARNVHDVNPRLLRCVFKVIEKLLINISRLAHQGAVKFKMHAAIRADRFALCHQKLMESARRFDLGWCRMAVVEPGRSRGDAERPGRPVRYLRTDRYSW